MYINQVTGDTQSIFKQLKQEKSNKMIIKINHFISHVTTGVIMSLRTKPNDPMIPMPIQV